jgi:hypothetical protein
MKRIIFVLFVLLLALAVTNGFAKGSDKDKAAAGKSCCAQGTKVSMKADAQKGECIKDGKVCDPKTCPMHDATKISDKSGSAKGQCTMNTASAKAACKDGSKCPMMGKTGTKKGATEKTSDLKGTN